MTISKTSTGINSAVVLLTCIVYFFVYGLYTAIRDNMETVRNKEYAILLANELMESSRQLTNNVRQYAVTGDSSYEKTYFGILDERSGKVARERGRKIAPGESVALTDLMRKYGVTDAEFALIDQGNKLSDALVALETEAMNAVKGIFKGPDGNFSVKGKPDLGKAQSLVFGNAYNGEVAKIMAPLNEFFRQLDQRTSGEVEHTSNLIVSRVIMLCVALGITLVLGIVAAIFIRHQVCGPIARLSSFASRVMNGEYGRRTKVAGNNEVGFLASSINAMLDKLQSELAFSEGAMAALPVPFAVFNSKGLLSFANSSMLETFHRSPSLETSLNLDSGTFFYNDPSRRTSVTKCLESRKGDASFMVIEKTSGDRIHAEIFTKPMYDVRQQLTHVVLVLMDMTASVEQGEAIKRSGETMREVAINVLDLLDAANTASDQLVKVLEKTDAATVDTASRMNATMAAMAEMNRTVGEVSNNALNASENADNMRATAVDGREIVDRLVHSISEVQKHSLELRKDMEKLGDEAQGINQILTVISDIADQTNLLALNAAIEAARAGEAGRGFAVVADEVRKLAEKTMSATSEVARAIENIQEGTKRNMGHVDKAVTSIEEVTGLASSSGEKLKDIVEISGKSADMVRAIATSSGEQSACSNNINDTVAKVDVTLKDLASVTADANSAAQMLSKQLEEIGQLMERLKG